MVSVKSELTPEEEFDEVAMRAYRNISLAKIQAARTKEELKTVLIYEYFHERAVDALLDGIIRSFKRKKMWEEREPEKVKIEVPPFAPPKPAERVVVRIIVPKEWTPERIEEYIKLKRREIIAGKEYVITRTGKRIEVGKYRSMVSRLAKAWGAPKREVVRRRWTPQKVRKYLASLKTETIEGKEYILTKAGKRLEKKEYIKRIKALSSAWNRLHAMRKRS